LASPLGYASSLLMPTVSSPLVVRASRSRTITPRTPPAAPADAEYQPSTTQRKPQRMAGLFGGHGPSERRRWDWRGFVGERWRLVSFVIRFPSIYLSVGSSALGVGCGVWGCRMRFATHCFVGG